MKRVELSNLYVPGCSNLHLPSQLAVALVGTPEQAGAAPIHTTAAAVVASWSVNMTSPPAAIVTLLAGSGFDPGAVQHGHSGSTQFSLTSSFASDGAAAVVPVGPPPPEGWMEVVVGGGGGDVIVVVGGVVVGVVEVVVVPVVPVPAPSTTISYLR